MIKKITLIILFVLAINNIHGMEAYDIQKSEGKCILALEILPTNPKKALIYLQRIKSRGYAPAGLLISAILFRQEKISKAIKELNLFIKNNSINTNEIEDEELGTFFEKEILDTESMRAKLNFLKKLQKLLPKEKDQKEADQELELSKIPPEILNMMYT